MRGEALRGPLRVGLIGFGRIGQRLARLIAQTPDRTRLVAVLVRPEQPIPPVTDGDGCLCHSWTEFVAASPDIAVECASADALRAHGVATLSAGVDLIPLSLAALTVRETEAALMTAAETGPGRLEIAAGAMGAIEMLTAARLDGLFSVTFRAAYPPMRWHDTPAQALLDAARVTAPQLFFTGSVREAASLFPRHINVAVAVALAGLGLDTTRAELIADPVLTQARFEIEANAGPGPLRLTVEGRDAPLGADPIDYTTFSVLRLLLRRTARIAT